MTNPRLIQDPSAEPGESEFCWGKGVGVPFIRGYDPEPFEIANAERRVPSDDANFPLPDYLIRETSVHDV